MAWLSIPRLFAPIIGPPVGGFITTCYHWRGIFWLNVPVGLIGLALALWWVPQVRSDAPRPMGSRSLDGRAALQALDFSRAFVAAGLVPLLPWLWFVRLAPDAGAEMSGHPHPPADEAG